MANENSLSYKSSRIFHVVLFEVSISAIPLGKGQTTLWTRIRSELQVYAPHVTIVSPAAGKSFVAARTLVQLSTRDYEDLERL